MSEHAPAVREIRTDEFELRSQAPGPALTGLVTRITSYRERISCGRFQRETVSLTVPLIIGFADPFAMAHGREPGDNERFVSFVGGLCTKPVIIRSEGDVDCIQIDFTPLGARLFFGMPMDALAERIVAVDDLADRGVAELRSRLGDVDDWRVRHRLAEEFVAARIAGSTVLSRPVALAYGAIVETGGRIAISALAGRLDWSRKHLAQTFAREVGLTPKSVARIARFGRAHAMAEARADWAGIAAECGYSDQAHLVREFVAFSGLTPTALAAG
jgi:AraC-like DNA-binding protein